MAVLPLPSPERRARWGVVILLAVTVIWGSSFFLIKSLLRSMTELNFLSLRFIIAAVLVLLFFPHRVWRAGRQTWGDALVLALLWTGGQLTQTVGLRFADASVVGVITGLNVVLTPFVLWGVFHRKLRPITYLTAFLAIIGLAVLSLKGLAFGFGESLTLLAAVFYAFHVSFTERYSRRNSAFDLGILVVLIVGLIFAVVNIPFGYQLPTTWFNWLDLLYVAAFAAFFCLVAQTWAQKYVDATKTAVILTMEPVLAALFAVLFGGEDFTWRLLFGGGLVVAAMFISELWPDPKAKQRISRRGRRRRWVRFIHP